MTDIASQRPTGLRARLRRKSTRLGIIGWLSIAVIVFWILVALLAPWIAPYREGAIVVKQAFGTFDKTGLYLGSDYMGRDVLSRIVYGARMTLGIAFAACVLSFLIGTTLGFAAALMGGKIDEILSRTNDAFLAFPSIMLALIVISTLGSSLTVLIVTVGFIEATRNFRVARAIGMEISALDFVEVARARGEGMWWILWNEILPGSIAALSTDFGLRFTYSILLVSTLSFIGLGVQPPHSDWGGLVRENMAGVHFFSNSVLVPAFCIFSITLAVNFLVDWNLARSNKSISSEIVK
ncbi:MAG: ABC transporter permease [Pseudorhodoplanes sp.]